MKNAIPLLLMLSLFIAGCNSETAEEAVQGYVSETLNDFKDQLPKELKQVDSLLRDSNAIKRKIAETTNLDSLEKYNELLNEAKSILRGVSSIDSMIREQSN